MNASCKPSIATEVYARHKRPHRLALLATSPVATGEAKQEEPPQGDGNVAARSLNVNMCITISKPYPRKGTEPTHRANRPNKKSSHISGCSFRVLLLTHFFSSSEYRQKDGVKRAFLIGHTRSLLIFPFVSGIL